jgi:hypothetical protein
MILGYREFLEHERRVEEEEEENDTIVEMISDFAECLNAYEEQGNKVEDLNTAFQEYCSSGGIDLETQNTMAEVTNSATQEDFESSLAEETDDVVFQGDEWVKLSDFERLERIKNFLRMLSASPQPDRKFVNVKVDKSSDFGKSAVKVYDRSAHTAVSHEPDLAPVACCAVLRAGTRG